MINEIVEPMKKVETVIVKKRVIESADAPVCAAVGAAAAAAPAPDPDAPTVKPKQITPKNC